MAQDCLNGTLRTHQGCNQGAIVQPGALSGQSRATAHVIFTSVQYQNGRITTAVVNTARPERRPALNGSRPERQKIETNEWEMNADLRQSPTDAKYDHYTAITLTRPCAFAVRLMRRVRLLALSMM